MGADSQRKYRAKGGLAFQARWKSALIQQVNVLHTRLIESRLRFPACGYSHRLAQLGRRGGRGRTPGSRITIDLPAASSRRTRSYADANSGLISPVFTIVATRMDISSSVRCGGEGHHQRIVNQPGEDVEATARSAARCMIRSRSDGGAGGSSTTAS